MENAVIIAILLVLVVIALLRVKKHFKGGCCGGSGNTVRIKKKLDAPVVKSRQLVIEGMHCENCAARVENALNRMDGISCRVNLRRRTADVACSVDISDEALKHAVEEQGYRVTAIR